MRLSDLWINFFIFKTRQVSLLLDTNFKFWQVTYSVPASFCLRFAFAHNFFVYCIWTKWEEIEAFRFTQRVKEKSCEIVVGQKIKFDFIFFLALLWTKDIHTFIQNGPTSTRQMTMHWNLRGRCLTFSRVILVFFFCILFFSCRVMFVYCWN